MTTRNTETLTTAKYQSGVVGYQKWRDLLFLHWPVPVEVLQPLLPQRLSVETFDGHAWVGMVVFDMHGVRPWWFPALPGVSAFHETNVRTYVNCDGQDPGVWFFSLDAANSSAVRIARWRWRLNYFRSTMRISRSANTIRYTGTRRWPGQWDAGYSIEAELSPDTETAIPGSFEHFLVERYTLYTQSGDGPLLRGDVRHTPYPLQPVTVTHCEESLIAAAGIPIDGPPEHAAFSPGVDVKILGLKTV